ncbi:uncharacterized protein [Coffea arabica]|uniref:Beta-1,3-glucosyltransferase-like n=1 Tax=Coffea arabica TaxID=13443 RepID=A0A6P6XI05_COFAR|nr:uncharacterized protein LOC113743562 [Coffea arabica]
MKSFQPNSKSHHPSRLVNLMIISCFLFLLYLLFSFLFFPNSKNLNLSGSLQDLSSTTSLEHIVFGIASNERSWSKRKEYVRLWWRPQIMKGCVFLEEKPPNSTSSENDQISLPPICISGDTSRFRYTFRNGRRSAIRVARVVSETVALNHSDVRWFVFGDDDTVFFPENLVKTLSKYDHGLWYYIGTNSENYQQNKGFSFDMAFGGAGFAISYPLAKVLAKHLDSCIDRYPHLYGSDGRIHACLTELGVTLTHEPGFHQMDVRGNIFGLLAAHPTRPLVSLHHLDAVKPIFPKMTAMEALKHLLEATKVDSQRTLQQTVCYDRWFSWTLSVSWGYAVQLVGFNEFLPDAVRMQETYVPWKRGPLYVNHNLNTAKYQPDPCKRPVVFFFDRVSSSRDGIASIYKKTENNCTFDKIQEVRVFSKKLDLDIKQLQAPRRQCCDVLPSSADRVMEINIRECGAEELIYMHA